LIVHDAPFLHAGEVFALAAALVWSGAVVLYKRASDTVHPIALNIVKNAFSLALFVPTILLAGGFGLSTMHGWDFAALVASGVLGISISDTYLFKALQLLGAGLYSIVVCLYGVFVISLSFLFLGERLTAVQLAGVALITGAVAVAVYQKDRTHRERSQVLLGLAWGVVAMLSIAISVVLMKDALNRVTALDAITVRVGAGLVALLPFAVGRSGARILATLRGPHWKSTLWGSFLGMYGATLLWVLGMQYTLASVASSLNQLSNVFVFVLAVLFLHERMTARKVAGILVATAGALLVILG
jgi:drug/metabolite transporter (DMT)-like permease